MKQFVDGVEDSDNEKEQDGGDKEEMELGEVDKRIEELEKEEKAELKKYVIMCPWSHIEGQAICLIII